MKEPLSIAPLFESVQLVKLTDEPTEGVEFKGENRGRIVFLCKTVSVPAGEEHEMLTKMLGGLKLTWDDLALICVENAHSFHYLKNQLIFKKLISFGFTPAELALNITADNYRLITFYDTKIIFSEPLGDLKENKNNAKDKLWRAVKEMFA